MNEIKFAKNGIEFEFVVESINYSGVKFKFKATGSCKEGTVKIGGYKHSAYISEKQNAIVFTAGTYAVIGGKKTAGVKPGAETFKKFVDMQNEKLAERKALKESLINGLLDGSITGTCGYQSRSTDGCEYQASNVDWNVDGEKLKVYDLHMADILDEAQNTLGLQLSYDDAIQGFSKFAKEVDCDKRSVLTLNELLCGVTERKTAKADKEKAIFDKAKSTGKKQELSRWIEDCNSDFEECNCDICVEYAMPDGTVKVERNHTY